MKNYFILLLVFSSTITASGADFFSTGHLEIYRTDWGQTLVSPNIIFSAGKFDGYAFWDRYLTDEGFYHGEFMLAFSPFRQNYWNKLSVISESRWDKYAKQENSIGLRIKIW